MTLSDQYNQGKAIIPPDGRYFVQMRIADRFETILEKRIHKNKGTNHLPVFGLRYISIPYMDFDVLFNGTEAIFKYRNGVLIDRLRKTGDKTWLGKLIYNRPGKDSFDKFIDYFLLKEKSWKTKLS